MEKMFLFYLVNVLFHSSQISIKHQCLCCSFSCFIYYQTILSTKASGLTVHSKTETVAAGFKIKISSTETFSFWEFWCIKTLGIHLHTVCQASFGALPFHQLVSSMAEHEDSLDKERNKTSPCFLPFSSPALSLFASILHFLTSPVKAQQGLMPIRSGRWLQSVPACPAPQRYLVTEGQPQPACPGSATGLSPLHTTQAHTSAPL